MKRLVHKRKFIFIPLIAAAFLALVSFVVMQLWNHLLPDILHVATIGFWQAMGLFILCKILFGFGRGGKMGPPWARGGMGEQFKNMSPEEKQRFKEQWKNRCRWSKSDTAQSRIWPDDATPGNA